MTRLIAYRLLAAIPLLLLASVAIFLLTHLMPGSPAAAILGEDATPERVAAVERQLGLDRSLPAQFATWFGDAIGGDLGDSLFTGRAIGETIGERILPTMSVAVAGILVAIALGLAAGLVSALRPGSLVDRLVSLLTAAGLAVPGFWLGIVLVLIFGVKLGLLPVIAWTPPSRDPLAWAEGLIMPAAAVGLAGSATIARQTRSAMLEALEAPFVQMLRAIGTPRSTIVLRYALKNAMVPVLTVTASEFVIMIGSSLVIEKVFTIPGLGALMVDAVTRKDIPVVQGVTLTIAAGIVVIYFLVDVCYALLNPRVRPS